LSYCVHSPGVRFFDETLYSADCGFFIFSPTIYALSCPDFRFPSFTSQRSSRHIFCTERIPTIEKVHGKLTGLKTNQVKRLSNLYRRKVPSEQVLNNELARALAELSLDIGKPISILIDRRGRVVTVSVGDAPEIPLPPLYGEANARLRGLRLVHTHLKAAGLSQGDLSKLFLNRLDAIVALEVFGQAKGAFTLGNAHLAQLAPPTAQEEDWIIDKPMTMQMLERVDILARLEALEQELGRTVSVREVKRSSSERAVLIGLQTHESGLEAESRLAELSELATSAGAIIAHKTLQHRQEVDARTLIGRGKLQEVVSVAYHEDADMLIFDRELNPAQAREIEEATNLKIIDRTQLILDIFAQNARGREAQVQVELAQLQYQLPRLAGRGEAMSRLGAGIGTRGPGESKLEVDRRRIRDRITMLENAVDEISQRRSQTRKSRGRAPTPVIALVGYTNAGKSTLFNTLAKADVISQNRLFATLRPTTREGWLPDLGQWGGKVLYTDTVGFIRDLPDELVNAFRATLEELHDADLLLHVVDGATPGAADRVIAVEKILDTLSLEVPRQVVINKADLAFPDVLAQLRERYGATSVSAVTKQGLTELKSALVNHLEHQNIIPSVPKFNYDITSHN
jgi:GTPase